MMKKKRMPEQLYILIINGNFKMLKQRSKGMWNENRKDGI